MAVVAGLVTMAALVAYSAGMPGAAMVIADRTWSVVNVFDDLFLWRRGAIFRASDRVGVATCFAYANWSFAYIRHMLSILVLYKSDFRVSILAIVATLVRWMSTILALCGSLMKERRLGLRR